LRTYRNKVSQQRSPENGTLYQTKGGPLVEKEQLCTWTHIAEFLTMHLCHSIWKPLHKCQR